MVVFQNQGLAQGINALSSTLGPILQEAAKQRRKSDILSRIFSKEPVDQQGQQSQQEEQPEDQQLQSPLNRGMNREALFEYAQVDPQGANFLLQQDIAREKMDLKKEERSSQRELALMKMNEPKIAEIDEKLSNLEATGRDLDRLNTIFTEHSDKLPSSLTAAVLDLEGEGYLSKIGRSQLSPEAQESIKIIVNQLRGAKDTFGARITNFEADKFLQGLPTLLNSPEGRRRITKQLGIVNKINQLYNRGILEAFEKAGGSGNITYSQALKEGRKKYKKEIDNLEERYKNPNRLKKVEKGTQINNEVVDQLLERTKGDPKKARELAKQLGYDVG